MRAGNSMTGMLIIGGLFFVFGFVTWLNGALIPFLTIACELGRTQAYFVTLAFYIAYTVMALPVSLVLKRTGYKNGLALGLAVMAAGALIFLPAALLRTYGVFLAGLFVLGTGLAILQTAANPYIVLMGPARTAAVRISIMGLLNKGAGIIAPVAFTALVLADVSRFTEARLMSLPPARTAQEARNYFGNEVDWIMPGKCGPLGGPTEIRDAATGKVLRPAPCIDTEGSL